MFIDFAVAISTFSDAGEITDSISCCAIIVLAFHLRRPSRFFITFKPFARHIIRKKIMTVHQTMTVKPIFCRLYKVFAFMARIYLHSTPLSSILVNRDYRTQSHCPPSPYSMPSLLRLRLGMVSFESHSFYIRPHKR